MFENVYQHCQRDNACQYGLQACLIFSLSITSWLLSSYQCKAQGIKSDRADS